ncbi:MAG: nucleoid-associated protein, partial [Clostridiaceae bacterium]|nr:nucleoid-associated protein [Clostridiaceae bacterium]
MRNIDEIIINKAVLNVLDRENDTTVLADKELELTEEVYEYFESHLLKILKDEEARLASFGEGKNIVKDICNEIFMDEEQFADCSGKLSRYLFRCMGTDEKEPSGDIAVCLFESREGRFLAIMKLNFMNSYYHFIKDNEGTPAVTVGINPTGLPGLNHKVPKAVVIREVKDDDKYDMLVLDRDKEGFFIDSFLKCTFTRDKHENTRIISRVSEQFARKAFKDNAQEAERFRARLSDHLRNEDTFDVQKVAEENFNDTMVKNEFKAVMVSEGITENNVPIDREWAEKKLKRK